MAIQCNESFFRLKVTAAAKSAVQITDRTGKLIMMSCLLVNCLLSSLSTAWPQ